MSNLLKNLLIALGLAIILFVGYVVFFRDGGVSDTQGDVTLSQSAELESQQLLATLNELRSLSVDGTVFSNPLFLSLRDFRIDLGSEPEGRQNPFSPIQ